jgi:aspartate ammonia-lyase
MARYNGHRYYGKQTKAALRNFPFSVPPARLELIQSIVLIKRSVARAALATKLLDRSRAQAIIRACEEALAGKLDDQFVTPSFQGGAGTSIHMNVNEVLATRGTELLSRGKRFKKIIIHPNDHVNICQSTNDVLPSALKIAMLRKTDEVLHSADLAVTALAQKAHAFGKIQKLGRTHLQDAVPITLGAEFTAYAELIKRDRRRIADIIPYLYELNLGGSAVGNGINVSPRFKTALYRDLRSALRLPIHPAADLAAQTMSATDFCALSSAFVMLTLDLSKIANDLRLLSSGPRGGIGEIKIAPLQAGSSIMPGKVNPVLLEALNQLHFFVMGNDLAIREGAQAAQLELSVMTPLIADRLLASATLIVEVVEQTARRCFSLIKANPKQCEILLDRSTAYATSLAPRLGYDTVASLVHEAIARNVSFKKLLIEKKLLSAAEMKRFFH